MSDDLLFVAFGRVTDPARALAAEGADLAAAPDTSGLGQQVALIGPGTPAFRLNSPGWLTPPPELIASLDGRVGLRLLCRDRLAAAIPPFAAAARRVVEAYLDTAEDSAEDAPGADATDIGVTHPSDLLFHAYLPLPNAHLWRVERDGATLTPVGEPTRFDLAFWTGSVLHALRLDAHGTLTPKRAAARDALIAASPVPIRTGDAIPEDVTHPAPPDGPVPGPYRARGFQTPLP